MKYFNMLDNLFNFIQKKKETKNLQSFFELKITSSLN